jgi:hypothetical protein
MGISMGILFLALPALLAAGIVDVQLVLNAKVVQAEYCVADPDADTLRLHLAFTVENRGDAPIVWYLGDKRIPRIEAAESAEALTGNTPAFSMDLTDISNTEGVRLAPKDFVVLPPGESIAFTKDVWLPVPSPGSTGTGLLQPGHYVARLQVLNWNLSDEEAARWTTKFQQQGTLWVKPLFSEPIPLDVQADHKRRHCSPE